MAGRELTTFQMTADIAMTLDAARSLFVQCIRPESHPLVFGMYNKILISSSRSVDWVRKCRSSPGRMNAPSELATLECFKCSL